ncbi:histidine kinase [Methylocystis sp. MJC1]|jgi:two-component system sensor histidine kinase UhpB|uniref:ATP-binding protein n=1 Tax=Methylocystis sp. MJC1 TaxID=2654282 RepID=UPI0013EAD434|nr:ATP-binding protein [Methylocystis sp. MJC1]KAF2990899.1 Sensor histidine kinase LiaS [Methylocystis sp. MJC1]MBU6527793.1 sensor histidine kinase [Methylocystis sp. MJC1]UZX10722.1 histidine kinase [Methylocystis sp. MJC1]
MLRKLTLRARLSLLLGAVMVAGLAFGIGLLILHAGTRVNAEAEGATRLARELVQATLPRLSSAQNPRAVLAELLEDARRLRHVRVIVEGEAPSSTTAEKHAPGWFSALVFHTPAPTRVATPLGSIEIAASSEDEIAEVWEEIVWLAIGAAAVATIAFTLVSYAVSRALTPIGALSEALRRLEQGDHAVRVPADGSREFVVIAERIDSLAATLQRLDAENRRLLRHMIHVQDEERRAIARDLHDEIGPFLFAVRAGVGALARKAQTPDAAPARLAEDCTRIDGQIAALQQVNRRILGRLRPAALEEMGLADAIEALARGWRETRAEIAIDLSLEGARGKLDETTAITAYRVVQEGLTNAFRHSGASRIAVAIARAGQRLRVEVRDDGTGLPAAFTPAGLGLRGMSERVSALGGTLWLDNDAAGGARLVAELPIGATPVNKTGG